MEKTIEGRVFKLHGLSTRVIRDLKKSGYDMAKIPEMPDFLERAEAMGHVLEAALDSGSVQCDLDELTPAGFNKLVHAVYDMTFVGEEEEKNSASPPASGRQGA